MEIEIEIVLIVVVEVGKSNEFIYRHFHCTFKSQPTARRQRKRHNVAATWRQLRKCVHYVTHTQNENDTWNGKWRNGEMAKMANGKKRVNGFLSFYLDFRWQMDFSFLFSFHFILYFSSFFFVTYFRRWRRRLRLWRRWCCYVCVFLVTKRVTST